tara:strand:- start:163 stop:471 length:309 start_codon:yes stop_codon:yes gene_type:complete
MKKIFLSFFIFILLNSCGGFDDAAKVLKNEKTRTTDEFLVKKREPLVLPPDFDKLPEPGLKNKKDNDKNDKIKDLLKVKEDSRDQINSQSSTENSILEKIRK